MITLEVLQKRRESLDNTLTASKAEMDLIKDRIKNLKKEIANAKGAIIELDFIIQSL